MKRGLVLLSAMALCVGGIFTSLASADTVGFVSFTDVDAKDVIFAAAGNAGNAAAITAAFDQNGTQAFAPVDIPLGAYGAGAVVTFNSIGGHVNCCGSATPMTPPDGDSGSTNLNAVKGISGIAAPTTMFLTGVFTNGNPAALVPPASLNFNTLTESFASLSPAMNQTFFIGDGLTGPRRLETDIRHPLGSHRSVARDSGRIRLQRNAQLLWGQHGLLYRPVCRHHSGLRSGARTRQSIAPGDWTLWPGCGEAASRKAEQKPLSSTSATFPIASRPA